MTNPIYATWCLSNNLGDALTVWLIEKITGQTPVYLPYEVHFPKYMVCGSILNHACDYTTVWGAGFAFGTDLIDGTPDIRAVRGPVTRERVQFQRGINIEIFGDPALLMPRFYNPENIEKKYKVGICPHYLHQKEVISWLKGRVDICFLNVFSTPEKFVDNLIQCEVVYSSSLHGLILADAYGIPSQWIEGTIRLGGDRTKFNDYLSSVRPEFPDFHTLHIQNLPEDLDSLYQAIIENKPPSEQIEKLCNDLWNVCPFKPEKQESENGTNPNS